jgi:hypothetical protein
MVTVDEEIELSDADVEYVDFDQYPGEPTSIEVLPDLTPIYCRTCTKYQAQCTCEMPKKEEVK